MDGGAARDAMLHGGRQKYSCVKALTQRLLSFMVKVKRFKVKKVKCWEVFLVVVLSRYGVMSYIP